MSQTIAHRPRTHVRIPVKPILVALVTAVIAAAVLAFINLPTQTGTTTQTSAGAAAAVQPAEVAKPESPAARRILLESPFVGVLSPAEWRVLHSHVQGTTLGSAGGAVDAPAAQTRIYVRGELPQFPGKAR